MLIGYKRREEGDKGRKEGGRGKNPEAPNQWENTKIQRRQDESSPVQRCPVKLAALYYSQLALSSSVVLVLCLKDNFTLDPLSSQTLLKVPACYYQQKSSVNAEMLYPLLLPPCHRWILKHNVIKKENMCWGCSIPLQQQSLHVQRPPWVCTVRAEGRLFPDFSGQFFSKVSAVPSPGQHRMLACPSESKGQKIRSPSHS